MKVISFTGREDLAVVYLAESSDGRAFEFVEALQPPLPRDEKWVLILSTLYGCPIKCSMCDAGDSYRGKLTKEEIFSQIDYLVDKRYPGHRIPAAKFKIQFARMGDPAFNPNVLDVLWELPERYDAPGLIPCISTVAPAGTEKFFDELLEIRDELYQGRFQMQFSLHTTHEPLRDRMIPAKKWSFSQISNFGERFHRSGDRKVALNFALEREAPIESTILKQHFDPDKFIIKITPLNPTYRASQSGHKSYFDPQQPADKLGIIRNLRDIGYEVMLSVGEADENSLGSNCGQLVMSHLRGEENLLEAYKLVKINSTLVMPESC